MGFYEQISKYYDYIFPAGEEQLRFIGSLLGDKPKTVLDVACGSGGYSVELAKQGHKVTAVDLDDEMVRKAETKARGAGVNVNVLKCDMLELVKTLTGKFACIFCIGNSIVHLGKLEDIQRALEQMRDLLDEDGVLVLQTINYDRIINNNISGLPTIKNGEIGLEFIRQYEYVEEKGIINFNTILNVDNKEVTEKFENSIELLPVRSSDLREMLEKAGFKSIKLYGDFAFSPHTEDSFMLVISAAI